MLTLASVILGWVLAPAAEPVTGLVKARRDEWSLASLPRRFEQTAIVGMVLSAGYWGANAVEASAALAAAAAPPPDLRWRIAAVFARAQDAGVLVAFSAPDKAPQRLSVGDTLPSGHRIVSVGEREVCVQLGKKTYKLGVERREN